MGENSKSQSVQENEKQKFLSFVIIFPLIIILFINSSFYVGILKDLQTVKEILQGSDMGYSYGIPDLFVIWLVFGTIINSVALLLFNKRLRLIGWIYRLIFLIAGFLFIILIGNLIYLEILFDMVQFDWNEWNLLHLYYVYYEVAFIAGELILLTSIQCFNIIQKKKEENEKNKFILNHTRNLKRQ
jgi:hypothetical protein